MPTILLHFLPYIAIGVMALAGWGLFEQHKVDLGKLDKANAQIIQDQKDRVADAKALATSQAKLDGLNDRAQPLIQRIMAAPTTTGCGPIVSDAVASLQQLRAARDQPRGPGAPQPLGVPLAGHPAQQPKAK